MKKLSSMSIEFRNAIRHAIARAIVDLRDEDRNEEVLEAITDRLCGIDKSTLTVLSESGDVLQMVLGPVDWVNCKMQDAMFVEAEYTPYQLRYRANDPTDCECSLCQIKRQLKEAGVGGPAGDGMGLTTEEVAAFFQSRCAGLGEKVHEDMYGGTIAPAAVESFASWPIGGDLADPVGVFPDERWPENDYLGYDLAQVPIGGSVYRVSCTPTLWWFNRRSEKEWSCTRTSAQWARVRDVYDKFWSLGAVLIGVKAAFAAELE